MKKELLISASLVASAWAAGTVSVDVTTATYNGTYAPNHVMAVWITDQSNKFVKTLEVDASTYVSQLQKWLSMNSSENKTDAVTSASLTAHKRHTLTWDCTDTLGNTVPNGSYRVWFEMNETNLPGPSMYTPIQVVSIANTVTPPNASYRAPSIVWNNTTSVFDTVFATTPVDVFKNISIAYTPAAGTIVPQFGLTVTAQHGTVAKHPDASAYDTNSVVTLTPVADSGYQFSGWSGDAKGAMVPYYATIDGAKNITANFTAIDASVDTINPSEQLMSEAHWKAASDPTVVANLFTDIGLSTMFLEPSLTLGSWATLRGAFDKDLSGASWVKVTYNSTCPLFMCLGDSAMVPNGYWHALPADTNSHTVLLKLDSTEFYIPSDSAPSAIDLSKVNAIHFGIDSTGFANGSMFQIVNIYDMVVYGKGTLMDATPVKTTIHSNTIPVGVQVTGRTIAITGITGNSTLELFTVSGRKVMSANLTGSQGVSIATLPTGFYLASVKSNGVVRNQRIMINQ